jgi:tetratricopeptide (TPR) repeat protein
VRFAQFGSPFLFGDVFWGPAHAEAFIEAQERGPWLDDVYGEAAIAMCLQKRRVAIYSYQLDRFDAEIAARLMRPLWPGWELRFTTRLTEVTPTVGHDLVRAWVRKARRGAAKQLEYHRRRDPLGALGQELSARWYDPADERFDQAHLAFKYGSGRAEARVHLEALLVDHPKHTRALGLLGRIAYLDGHDDEARRLSEEAVALDPEDFEPWATLGLVSARAKDLSQQVRFNTRAFECAPHPWIVHNLVCACLDRAEVLPLGHERSALLERALELATTTNPPTASSRWSEACALSLLEGDVDRAWSALGEALGLERQDRERLLTRMKADPQLAWVWRTKEGHTLPQ